MFRSSLSKFFSKIIIVWTNYKIIAVIIAICFIKRF